MAYNNAITLGQPYTVRDADNNLVTRQASIPPVGTTIVYTAKLQTVNGSPTYSRVNGIEHDSAGERLPNGTFAGWRANPASDWTRGSSGTTDIRTQEIVLRVVSKRRFRWVRLQEDQTVSDDNEMKPVWGHRGGRSPVVQTLHGRLPGNVAKRSEQGSWNQVSEDSFSGQAFGTYFLIKTARDADGDVIVDSWTVRVRPWRRAVFG